MDILIKDYVLSDYIILGVVIIFGALANALSKWKPAEARKQKRNKIRIRFI